MSLSEQPTIIKPFAEHELFYNKVRLLNPNANPYILEHSSEVLMRVHEQGKCAREHCPVHNLSHHHMRDFPQTWDDARKGMYRRCEHNFLHPDPDDPFVRDVHSCDGCCESLSDFSIPRHLSSVLTEVAEERLNDLVGMQVETIYYSPQAITFALDAFPLATMYPNIPGEPWCMFLTPQNEINFGEVIREVSIVSLPDTREGYYPFLAPLEDSESPEILSQMRDYSLLSPGNLFYKAYELVLISEGEDKLSIPIVSLCHEDTRDTYGVPYLNTATPEILDSQDEM